MAHRSQHRTLQFEGICTSIETAANQGGLYVANRIIEDESEVALEKLKRVIQRGIDT